MWYKYIYQRVGMKKGASLFVILLEYTENTKKKNRKTCVKGGSSYGIYEWKGRSPAGYKLY